MKKIYFLFTFICLAFAAIGQNQCVFDFTSASQLRAWDITPPQKPSSGTTVDGKTVMADDGTTISLIRGKATTENRIWNNGGKYELRTYKGAQLTIECPRNITRIEFEFAGDRGLGVADANGTYTKPPKEKPLGVWTGNATSVTFDSFKATFKKVTVYQEVGQVSPMPVFSHDSGTYFSDLNLTITNETSTNFLIRYNYQVYKNGELVTDSKATGESFNLRLALVRGQVTTYDVDVIVTKGNYIPSQKVRKTYILREKGAERIFEKVTSIKQMTEGSNFVILNMAGDRIMTSQYDHIGKFSAAACKVSNDLVNTGEVVDPMIFKLVNIPNTEKCRLKVDGQDLYLCLNGGSNGFNVSNAPELDLSTEWMLRPTDLQIENAFKTSKYVTYYERDDMFSFYTRSKTNLITIYKERTDGRPLPKYCPNPQFSLRPDTYIGARELQITADLANADVLVTMRRDGVTVWNGKRMSLPATINLDIIGVETEYDIEAKVVRSGYGDSEVIRKVYTVKDDPFQDYLKAQIVIKDVAEAEGWTDATKYSTLNFLDENRNTINFEVTGGGNDGKFYTSDKSWRVYTGGQMKITLPRGYYFNHIEFFMSKGGLSNATWSDGKFYPSEGVAKNSWAPSKLLSEVTFTCASKVQFTGFNVFYTSNTSGVEEEVAVEAQIVGVNGGVQVIADAGTAVAVYTLAGQLVGQYDMAGGEQMIELPQGFYIVRAGETIEKVIVK